MRFPRHDDEPASWEDARRFLRPPLGDDRVPLAANDERRDGDPRQLLLDRIRERLAGRRQQPPRPEDEVVEGDERPQGRRLAQGIEEEAGRLPQKRRRVRVDSGPDEDAALDALGMTDGELDDQLAA